MYPRQKQGCVKITQLVDLYCGAEEDRTPDLRIANATLSLFELPPHDQRIAKHAVASKHLLARDENWASFKRARK
ncbi:hypothetical protein CCP4SC76_6970002 [Gammaproteobacteria bacterium]